MSFSLERIQFLLSLEYSSKLDGSLEDEMKCVFFVSAQTALCDYEDKEAFFAPCVLFCFVRNKVKEVIEADIKSTKKIKTKRYREKKTCQSNCWHRAEKAIAKKTEKATKNLLDWNFYSKADTVYCIYFTSLTFPWVTKIIVTVFIGKLCNKLRQHHWRCFLKTTFSHNASFKSLKHSS